MAQFLGPLLVALGAMLWATDTPFRYPIAEKLDPTVIVFVEHLIGTLVLALWILFKRKSQAFSLRFLQWMGLIFIGIGGSALATVLFTASFRFVNPSVAILLQKLQPILVVLFAALFLKERPEKRFYGWATLALIAALVLSLPEFNFRELSQGLDLRSTGALFALGAATFWALSTVVGKAVLAQQPFDVVSFWRYAFGLLGLLGILSLSSTQIAPGEWTLSTLQALLYLGLVPGLLALLLYYAGLTRTPASVATFVELLYPVSAIALNTFLLKMPLTPVQVGAGLILIFSVTQISRN